MTSCVLLTSTVRIRPSHARLVIECVLAPEVHELVCMQRGLGPDRKNV